MVADGDPLETPTQVKQLFIKGNPVDLDNKQKRLYEKYLNRPRKTAIFFQLICVFVHRQYRSVFTSFG